VFYEWIETNTWSEVIWGLRKHKKEEEIKTE